MDIKERIKRFGEENRPFYLCDHGDGMFSLCLAFSFFNMGYEDYGREAFNAYAREIGDPEMEEGLYTHGNGYEWEDVFRKAFEHEPGREKIEYDCEAGGFFCRSRDLSLLENFGKRFRLMVEDEEQFTALVSAALKEAAVRRAEEERLSGLVRGFVMKRPNADVDMLTPWGRLLLTADMGQRLLSGKMQDIRIGQTRITADEFLDQKIAAINRDLLADHCFQMKTEAEEPDEAVGLSMHG